MLLVELAQGVVQLRIVRERDFGILRDNAGVLCEGGAKSAQALAAGIHHAERFAEEQDGFKTLFDQMFRGNRCRLGVIQPDHITGEIGDFTVNQHHRQRRLLQAVQPLFAHPDGVDHNPFDLVAAQQVEIMQFLIHFVVGVTHQRGKAFIAAGGFNAA